MDVINKTALKLSRKCRILMTLSNGEKILVSLFYEADTIYIGARTSGHPMYVNRATSGTSLVTDKERECPKYIKLAVIAKDNQYFMKKFIMMKVRLSKGKIITTDGKPVSYP